MTQFIVFERHFEVPECRTGHLEDAVDAARKLAKDEGSPYGVWQLKCVVRPGEDGAPPTVEIE